jgi:sialic acid synthase SpsE/sugar phosphate isomerase/epimerase
MFKTDKLDKLFSGVESPVYIICEIGINHNGDVNQAIKLIESAKKAGVDAVKFQKRNLKEIYTENILNNVNSAEWNFDYLLPLLKETELSFDDYVKIREKCDELELDLIITPFDTVSADFIAKLGITAFKISSADMTNIGLIEKCNSYGLPIIISTGMWSKDDIKKCSDIYKRKNIRFSFLHAQSTYPSPFESLNLSFIEELKTMSDVVGFSGHERGNFIPIAAVAMGCKIIEKHITFDKNQTGPDHKASMLPEEWNEMVSNIRLLEIALSGCKKVNQAETLNKELFAKSATTKKNLHKGHVLTKEDILFKSPGKGIFPHEIEEYYGKVLGNDIKENHYISKEDFSTVIDIKNWDKFSYSNDWGLKCRFHDFETYDIVPSKIIEFHCSQSDLDYEFTPNLTPNGHQLIVHAPEIFDRKLFDLCTDDEYIVNRSKEILTKTIERTLELSKHFPNTKPKIVCHLGGMSLDLRELKDTRPMMDNAINNFKEFEKYKDVVDILPENLPSRPWYLGGEWYQHGFASAEDMRYFCDHYGLGMTYDICHAFLYCQNHGKDIVEYTKTVMPIAKHIHISDAYGINGEGLQIGAGEMDLDSIFEVMRGNKFSWVTEIWGGHLHKSSGTYKALQLLEKYNYVL